VVAPAEEKFFFEIFFELVSCLSRHFDAPACESLRSGPRMLEVAPRSPLGEIREDFTVKRSGNDFHRKAHFISSRLATLAAHDEN